MAKLGTRPSRASVTESLANIEGRQQRADSRKVAAMMRRATGKRAKMRGANIVGYGSYRYYYRNASGRDVDFMIIGFSPCRQALTVYIMSGFSGFAGLMTRLGKYKTAKFCLYIKRLSDVDEKLPENLITESVRVA